MFSFGVYQGLSLFICVINVLTSDNLDYFIEAIEEKSVGKFDRMKIASSTKLKFSFRSFNHCNSSIN